MQYRDIANCQRTLTEVELYDVLQLVMSPGWEHYSFSITREPHILLLRKFVRGAVMSEFAKVTPQDNMAVPCEAHPQPDQGDTTSIEKVHGSEGKDDNAHGSETKDDSAKLASGTGGPPKKKKHTLEFVVPRRDAASVPKLKRSPRRRPKSAMTIDVRSSK